LRVLQVSDGYAPATGGLERVVQLLAAELVRRGHPTTVATLSRPDAPAREQHDGVDVRRLDGYTRHLRRFAADASHFFHPTCADPQLARRLTDLIEEVRPDVVHAHGWILNSCLSLHLPPSVALVATLHDFGLTCAKKTLIPHDRLDSMCEGAHLARCLRCATDHYGAVKGPALAVGLRHSMRRMDEVSMFMPISSVVRAASLGGVPVEKICQIPSFVADEVVDMTPREFGEARPASLPDGPFVLFVGALGEHKGVGLLLEAHRRMQIAAPLVMIGARRSDAPPLTGTKDRPVIVRAGVPHREIMSCFAAASVAVVPSRWQEPLGLVAIEAMAAGTPVVVTRVGALPEVVVHERTGLVVEPGDPDALAQALDRVLEDPVLQRGYGAAGRVRARRYAASAIVPRVIDGYERALGTLVSSCPI
jgi:glycosyltransferase involved in cell wall biosynthesis